MDACKMQRNLLSFTYRVFWNSYHAVEEGVGTPSEIFGCFWGNLYAILNRTDVDKVLLYRLEQIQFFTEENTGDIVDGVATYDNIKLYDSADKKKNPDKAKALMSELIFDYIKDLIAKDNAMVS